MPTPCPHCGAEMVDGERACCHCGAATPPPQPTATVNPLEPVPFVPTFSVPNDLEGLSGWLILAGISLLVTPLIYLYSFATLEVPIVFGGRYHAFLEDHRGLSALILFETVTNTVFMLWAAYLIYLFFSKKRLFPVAMILFLGTRAALVLADHFVLASMLPSNLHATSVLTVARNLVASVIWIPYFLLSRRVKATFIR